MARLTKADAARQLGIARSTLYKLLDQGILSAAPDGLIDSAELVRVATSVDRLRERSRTSADVFTMDTQRRGEEPQRHLTDSDRERPQTPIHERPQTPADDRRQTYADMLVDLLQTQLRQVQEAVQQERDAAQERERAYREHIAQLTTMLEQAHQQNQRLLEAPRSLPPVPSTPPPASPAPVSSDSFPSRSTVRQRILALLRAHPEGLTPAEMRVLLGADRRLANTCTGMLRNGLLRRVGRGRYVVA